MSTNIFALALTATFLGLLALWVPFLELVSRFALRHFHSANEEESTAPELSPLQPLAEYDGAD